MVLLLLVRSVAKCSVDLTHTAEAPEHCGFAARTPEDLILRQRVNFPRRHRRATNRGPAGPHPERLRVNNNRLVPPGVEGNVQVGGPAGKFGLEMQSTAVQFTLARDAWRALDRAGILSLAL